MEAAAAGQRQLPGTNYVITDYVGRNSNSNDLVYYVFELGRLRELVREMCRVFDEQR